MEHQEVYSTLSLVGKVQDFQMAADKSDLYKIKEDQIWRCQNIII